MKAFFKNVSCMPLYLKLSFNIKSWTITLNKTSIVTIDEGVNSVRSLVTNSALSSRCWEDARPLNWVQDGVVCHIGAILSTPLWIKWCNSFFFLNSIFDIHLFSEYNSMSFSTFYDSFEQRLSLIKAIIELFPIMWIISNLGILVAPVSRLLICTELTVPAS